MKLPLLSDNSQQERLGVSAVMTAMAKCGQIWRETPHTDIGIDGQIEHVSAEGEVTGKILAVQVKSGKSFFSHADHEAWHFYPEEKHRIYWERFPVPVLLCLHNPADGKTYWADARHWLRSPSCTKSRYIAVPKNQVLEETPVEQLFAMTGAGTEAFLSIEGVLGHLLKSRTNKVSFPVSYFEIFVFGLTNICRTLYFNMDVVMKIAEYKHVDEGWKVDPADHNFIFDFVRFVTSQHIADVDFSDCMIEWYDRQMMPSFLAPLTSRGRELLELIGHHEDRLRQAGKLKDICPYNRVAQESFMSLDLTPFRFPLVLSFMEVFPSESEDYSAASIAAAASPAAEVKPTSPQPPP